MTSKLKRLWPWLVISVAIHGLLLLSPSDQEPLVSRPNEVANFMVELLSVHRSEKPKQAAAKPPTQAKQEIIVMSKAKAAARQPKRIAVDHKPSIQKVEQSVTTEETKDIAFKPPVEENIQAEAPPTSKQPVKVESTTATKPAKLHADAFSNNDMLVLVRNHLETFKVYPTSARRRGIEGHVDVSFSLSHKGAAKQLRLLQSSGYIMLDRAALKTVERAQPFPVESGSYRFRLSFKQRGI